MKRQLVLGVVLSFFTVHCNYAQLTQEWAMNQLYSYSNTSYEIVNGFKSNGSSISHDGYTRSSTMNHLKYCELEDLKSFLNSIDITVHETAHAYDSQIPYMKANQGSTFTHLNNTEGFYLDPFSSVCIEFPKSKLFPNNELVKVIPESLRTFRFNTYINAGPTQSTQCDGVVGLMDEFNAYYHGSKVLYDLYPLFKEAYGTGVSWSWPSKFVSNADAFYEFDFFIKEYLLYAKQHHPALYQELKTHPTFSYVYKSIHKSFSTLMTNYEKKYDELNKQFTWYLYNVAMNDSVLEQGPNPMSTMSYLSTGDTNVVVYMVNSGYGCDLAVDTSFINAIYPAIANFEPSSNVQSFFNPTFDFVNTSENATEFYWDLGECDPSLDFSELFSTPSFFYDPNSVNILGYTYGCPPGVYDIQLIASNMGYCPDTIIASIRIEPDALLYVPNSFTPDGKEHNNYFYPVFSHAIDPEDYAFRIYNRWGELIFETHELPSIPTTTTNTLGAWNGDAPRPYGGKVKTAQDQVYTWEVFYKLPNADNPKRVVGHVTVIR